MLWVLLSFDFYLVSFFSSKEKLDLRDRKFIYRVKSSWLLGDHISYKIILIVAIVSFRLITAAFRCDVLSFVSNSSCDCRCSNCFLEVVSSQETKEGSRWLQDSFIVSNHLKFKVTKKFALKLAFIQHSFIIIHSVRTSRHIT